MSLKYLFPPPEFLTPPPGGLWADLPARAVAHRRPLSSEISQYNGTLSALLNPKHSISSTYRNTHIHIQGNFWSRKLKNSAKEALYPKGAHSVFRSNKNVDPPTETRSTYKDVGLPTTQASQVELPDPKPKLRLISKNVFQ